jgi:hypothetical protein
MHHEELRDAVVAIRHFLDGTGDKWEWDDFISVPAKNQEVARLQGFCQQLPELYPPVNKTDYRSATGLVRLREILAEVEGSVEP